MRTSRVIVHHAATLVMLVLLAGMTMAGRPAPSTESGLASDSFGGASSNTGISTSHSYVAPIRHDGPGQGAKNGGRSGTYYVATDGTDAAGQDGSEANPWLTLKYALTRVAEDDAIWIKPGTYLETGQLVVDKNLWIAGWGFDQTILNKAEDTGNPSSLDARAWFLVEAGKYLELSDLTLDGTGRQICIGVLGLGKVWVHGCHIENISWTPSSYYGRGVCAYGGGGEQNAVTDCEFANIGRIGVFTFGSGIWTQVTNVTYAGKGLGDHLDYAFEAGGGAEIAVYCSNVSACTGVAGDGSTSAGILATTYFAPGTVVSAIWNVITDCTTGVAVGYDGTDATYAQDISHNWLEGNAVAIGNNNSANVVNAPINWYGGYLPAFVAGKVTTGVDYSPWVAGGTGLAGPEPAPCFNPNLSVLWVDDSSPAYYPALGVIQEGVNLVSGSTVNVAAGTYSEHVTISNVITLQGAGPTTIIDPATDGPGITLAIGGSSATTRVVVKDLKVTGVTGAGNTGSGITVVSGLPDVSHITIDHVDCLGNSYAGFSINYTGTMSDLVFNVCNYSSNGSDGFRVPASLISLDGLTITGGHMDGNIYGWEIYAPGLADPGLVTNVAVTGTTFSNNTSKGIYAERLDHATFDGITVNNSGTAGGFAAGIDINLKFRAYQDITMQNSTVSGCGGGDPTNGVGVTVKARDDGGTYGPNPATLTGVDITGCTITGCQNGIRFGEPAKNNAGPQDVTVASCLITANSGAGRSGLSNETQTSTIATCNWWGSALGPNVLPGNPSPGDNLVGSASYAPWWTTSSGPCDGYGPNHVSANTSGLCLSTVHPCVTVPVVFTRADVTPARGASVIFQLSANLELCGTMAASIHQGSWLAGFSNRTFQTYDNGGGSYTVDQAILGLPCGVATGGTLFTVDVKRKTGQPDGVGSVTVTSVIVRNCSNVPLAGIPGASGQIGIDYTPPVALAGLLAQQQKLGNDPDGTTKVNVSFTPPSGGGYATTDIYRKGFGNYPEYDDSPSPGSVPSIPATPAAAIGAGWVLAGSDNDGAFADETTVRDFYYYVAFSKDDCGNVSAVSNMTIGTLNYHLGDISDGVTAGAGNNQVFTEDISLLGNTYGKVHGDVGYLNYADVGPTTSYSVDARPTTDNRINFEDLMMVAINYLQVGLRSPAPVQVSRLPVLQLTWDLTGRSVGTAHLRLAQNEGRVKGVHALIAYDRTLLELVGIAPGALSAQDNVFFKELKDVAGVVVDAAKLGAGTSFNGDGDVAILHFRVRAGNARATLAISDLRGVNNEFLDKNSPEIPMSDGSVVSKSARVEPAFLGAHPNPFLGQTEIRFRLAAEGRVTLRIFDASGRLVRTLADGAFVVGEHGALWDGRSEDGRTASPGVYFYTFQANGLANSRKLILLQ